MIFPTDKAWIPPKEIPSEINSELAQYSPIMRQVLFNRDYETLAQAQAFLKALPPENTQPQNLLGMAAALERIRFAIRKGEKIAVYGDYDADGVTATALLTEVIQRLGGNVRGYIPNRFDDGYGLNIDAIDQLYEQGIGLIITVDCGARSLDEASHAHQIGMDLIVTDHHRPADELPIAKALINPKQPGDNYPDKDLVGVGLAYKLACGLLEEIRADVRASSKSLAVDYLDLVAIGTVADLAPLRGENRHLVRTGLEYIRRPYRQGIRSLLGAAGIDSKNVTAENLGYGLAPRLNAAGRLETAMAALQLLLTKDVQEAGYLAQKLDLQNRERQEITRQIQSEAEKKALTDDPGALLLFAADESYNEGVIGLAAARLTEKFYRPAIVAKRGDEFTRGSCRSIPEFHITEALDQCADLLVRHGGHAAAAGFTVKNRDLFELIERLKNLAQTKLADPIPRPSVQADAVVELYELTPDLLGELKQLEPTGSHNPPAVFISHGVRVVRKRTVGKDQSHLKMTLSDGKITYDAIGFRLGHLDDDLPLYVDVLFTFETNRYNEVETLQLNIKDIHPSSGRMSLISPTYP